MSQAPNDLLHHRSPMPRMALGTETGTVPAEHTAWRVLVVDSHTEDGWSLTEALRRQGHQVEHAGTGLDALESFGAADVDLVLLDLDLPDTDGLQVCRRLRESPGTGVIVLTARGCDVDVVLGLQAGADDYLVKPCGLRELLARMAAVMRRVRPAPEAEPRVLSIGALRIDAALREVRLGGRCIAVTRKEFDLLYLLATRPETVVTREQLMREVWGDSWSRRTVDTHVSSLRHKLGAKEWIVTVHGVGFRIGRG